MTVTREAGLDLKLIGLRQALTAVPPHASKTKTGDEEAINRVRLIFAAGWLFVAATNGSTSALARVRITEDTRGALGVLDPDDAPILVDLQLRRIKLLLQQFKPNKSEEADHQLIHVDLNFTDPEEPVIDFTDVGGLWSAGESQRWPLEPAHEGFPDILSIAGTALERAGESRGAKDLIADPKLLAMFAASGKAYAAPVQIRATGTDESRGFLVACGPDFIGTIESRHDDDGGIKRRDSAHLDWLNTIGRPKLKAV